MSTDELEREMRERDYHIEIIPLDEIRTDRFPNTRFLDHYAVHELAQSIQDMGLIEPLIVRDGPGGLDLICGFRRMAALRELHETDAPCRIVRCTDVEARKLNVLENLARRELTPPEAAIAVTALADSGMSAPQIARATSERLGTVERWLAIRRGLAPAVWAKFLEPVDSIANGIARKDYRETLFQRVAKHKPVDQMAMLLLLEAQDVIKSKGGRPKGSKDSAPRKGPPGVFLTAEACAQIVQWLEELNASEKFERFGAYACWDKVRNLGVKVHGRPKACRTDDNANDATPG